MNRYKEGLDMDHTAIKTLYYRPWALYNDLHLFACQTVSFYYLRYISKLFKYLKPIESITD